MPFIVETGGRINAAGLQFLSRILPLEAEGTSRRARLDLRGGMDVLHCAASHGHWRFSRATCLHRLPRRYTRLIVLLKIWVRGATASWPQTCVGKNLRFYVNGFGNR